MFYGHRIHRDVNLAERVAERVLELEPENKQKRSVAMDSEASRPQFNRDQEQDSKSLLQDLSHIYDKRKTELFLKEVRKRMKMKVMSQRRGVSQQKPKS